MLYIIEGPDKCGKSTFIEKNDINIYCEGIDEFKTQSKFINRHIKIGVHFDATDKDPIESLKICAAMSQFCDVYMDRSWISEMVYGVVYRGETTITPKDEKYILWLLKETPHIIYYFDTPIAEPDTVDFFESDEDKMKLVRFRYAQIIARYSDCLNVYNVQVAK
jgi:thymidylate kinase